MHEKIRTINKFLAAITDYQTECSFEKVLREVKEHHKFLDVDMIIRAYNYAEEMHRGIFRKSGEPYIVHPLRVAYTVALSGADAETVTAALLHDVVEDCREKGASIEKLEEDYGMIVANIVDAVTKLSTDTEIPKAELDIMSEIKMQSTMNPRALLVKAADRIDNLKTIESMPEEKQLKKAQRTREIILPMIRDVGAYMLADILEELCFKTVHKDIYGQIEEKYQNLLSTSSYSTSKTLDLIKRCFNKDETSIQEKYKTDGLCGRIVNFSVDERYLISVFRYLKTISDNVNSTLESGVMNRKNVALYDLMLILDDSVAVKDSPVTSTSLFFTYLQNALLANGIYVVKIKKTTNGKTSYYKIQDSSGNFYRLFVRTESEYYEYCFGKIMIDDDSVLNYDVNEVEPRDTYAPRITVFRKNGQRDSIEAGASVLDFAFQIHTDIGLHFSYALVNGSMAQMGPYTRVNDNDTIEIVYKKEVRPSIEWFRYLTTSKAKDKLVRYFQINHLIKGEEQY